MLPYNFLDGWHTGSSLGAALGGSAQTSTSKTTSSLNYFLSPPRLTHGFRHNKARAKRLKITKQFYKLILRAVGTAFGPNRRLVKPKLQ